MESLEKQIREALIVQRAEELYKSFREPGYQNLTRKLGQSALNFVHNFLFLKKPDKSLKDEFEGKLNSLFSDTKALKQHAHRIASRIYMTREEIDEFLENHYLRIFKEKELNMAAFEEFKKANRKALNGIYYVTDQRNEIISRLVQIAKKEGVNKAISKRIRYSVIRQIFPTADCYIKNQLQDTFNLNEYLAHTRKAMATNQAEETLAFGAVIGGLQKALEDMSQVFEKIRKEKVYKEAKEIYDKI